MTLYPRREVVPVLLRLAKREDTCLLMLRAFVCFVCQAMRPSGRVACFFPSATFRRLTMDFGALTMDFSALTTYLGRPSLAASSSRTPCGIRRRPRARTVKIREIRGLRAPKRQKESGG